MKKYMDKDTIFAIIFTGRYTECSQIMEHWLEDIENLRIFHQLVNESSAKIKIGVKYHVNPSKDCEPKLKNLAPFIQLSDLVVFEFWSWRETMVHYSYLVFENLVDKALQSSLELVEKVKPSCQIILKVVVHTCQ